MNDWIVSFNEKAFEEQVISKVQTFEGRRLLRTMRMAKIGGITLIMLGSTFAVLGVWQLFATLAQSTFASYLALIVADIPAAFMYAQYMGWALLESAPLGTMTLVAICVAAIVAGTVSVIRSYGINVRRQVFTVA